MASHIRNPASAVTPEEAERFIEVIGEYDETYARDRRGNGEPSGERQDGLIRFRLAIQRNGLEGSYFYETNVEIEDTSLDQKHVYQRVECKEGEYVLVNVKEELTRSKLI